MRSKLKVFLSLSWAERRRYYGARLVRLLRWIRTIALAPVYYPFASLLSRVGVRIISTRPGSHKRIGQHAMELQFYVKAEMAGLRPRYRTLHLAARRSVANAFFRNLWRQRLTVVTNPVAETLLAPFAWMRPVAVQTYPHDSRLVLPDGRVLKGHAAHDEAYIRYFEMHGNKPVLTLPPTVKEKGWRALEQLGLPRGAWFAALHVREAGFIPGNRHADRNDDVLDYMEAATAVTMRGGWVVRLGNPTMKRLPPTPGVIDYVFTDARSDWMDIFLLAECRFFFGSDSGPCMVPGIFGRGCAIANVVPIGTGFWQPYDLHTRKLMRSKTDGRVLTFPEVMLSGLRDVFAPEQFEKAGMEWVPNTPAEIASLVVEMIERLDGVARYTPEDEMLQESFRALLRAKPTEYTFGAQARLGRDFARSRRDLFGETLASLDPETASGSKQP